MEIKKEKQTKNYQIKFSVEKNGETAAWAFLIVVFNDRHKEPYGLLENVYVLPEYRGQGIATELTKTVITEAKAIGCYKLIGQSRYGKDHVHALYQKYGFKDHGKNFRMDLIDSKPLQVD